LNTAVMTLAATQLSMTACEKVNSSVPKPTAVPTIKPLVESKYYENP
jgi:hypothetical protein